MTTGKPQQMSNESNSSDDLIAELSKLMAQDAHGNRQDVKAPQTPPTAPDLSARPAPVAETAPQAPVAPFAVRIPGAAPTPSVEPAPALVPRFDFSRVAEPVATIPRQEPSFAPVPPAATPPPAAASGDEPAPFHFDFNFDQPSQNSTSEQQNAAPAAPPAAALADDEHDAIADLIAAELRGDVPAETAPVTAPVAVVEPAKIEVEPAEPVVAVPKPVQASEPAKAAEPAKVASWVPTAVAANLADRPAQPRPTLRPVNLTPLHKTETAASDTFRIPPVFGLGTTPPAANVPPAAAKPAPLTAAQAVAPQVTPKPRAEHGYLSPTPAEPPMAPPANDLETGRDPIDEIESLIGRAVRVELDTPREPAPVRPTPTPALRSLATPTVPQQPAPRTVSGADETIMAAAAATGAEIGWVDHEEDRVVPGAKEPRRRRERAPRRPGMLRAFVGPLVAIALLLAAGFGLYSVLGLGGTSGPAPVIVADTAPIKQVPTAKSPVEQAQQSIVFNEMDGVVPGAEEQLVSRDQADVNEVTAIPPTAAVTDEGLANRKVRTVTVRPDGSIVSGEDNVAGAAILPVDRPNVPDVPGAGTASPSLLASANATEPTPATTAPATAAPAASTPVAAAPAAPAAAAPLVPGTELAVVDASGAPVAGKTAPVPYVRPASVGDAPPTGPVNAVVAAPQASLSAPAASLPPAPTQNLAAAPAAPVAAQSSTNAPAYAQLSSQRSPEVAQQIANELSTRYAALLNGTKLEITRADLGERGTYYRVRVPAASTASAAQFCATVKANGGDCVAM